MELKQISKWIVIAGAIIILVIKSVIRPLQLFGDPLRFFLNIAPNLLSAFLVPFMAYWFFSGRDFMIARIFRIQSAYDLRQVCLLGFLFLVINEYMQQFPVFGRTFDLNDILFSSLGLAFSWFIFGRLLQRREFGAEHGWVLLLLRKDFFVSDKTHKSLAKLAEKEISQFPNPKFQNG